MSPATVLEKRSGALSHAALQIESAPGCFCPQSQQKIQNENIKFISNFKCFFPLFCFDEPAEKKCVTCSKPFTFAEGNEEVTRARNDLLSYLSVSQQFFRLLTEDSRVLRAFEARAWAKKSPRLTIRPKGRKGNAEPEVWLKTLKASSHVCIRMWSSALQHLWSTYVLCIIQIILTMLRATISHRWWIDLISQVLQNVWFIVGSPTEVLRGYPIDDASMLLCHKQLRVVAQCSRSNSNAMHKPAFCVLNLCGTYI